jgi:hypothetical protein
MLAMDGPMISIQSLIDAAVLRPLAQEEVQQLEEQLRTNDQAVEQFVERCQLEVDLFLLLGGSPMSKFLLADRDTLADQLKHQRLRRPTDARE